MQKGDFQLIGYKIHRSFSIRQKAIKVLHGVSLSVRPGEKLFLQGPSGAGKTTLLYTLAGLEQPDIGIVSFNGLSLYEISGKNASRCRNRNFGFIFQSYHLLPELTALENVTLPTIILGKKKRDYGEFLLNEVGLGGRLNHLPGELSGGEQQRVAIARALINEPDILFTDEPTGNLDSKTGGEIMQLILTLANDSNRTLIVVTHDSELTKNGDRTLSLKDGKLN